MGFDLVPIHEREEIVLLIIFLPLLPLLPVVVLVQDLLVNQIEVTLYSLAARLVPLPVLLLQFLDPPEHFLLLLPTHLERLLCDLFVLSNLF